MLPLQQVLAQLFSGGLTPYAILDGAQVPDLPQRLHTSGLEQMCLYRGDIPDDLAQVAPYLVALQRDAGFTAWILQQGWGLNWGIYARVDAQIKFQEVRKHFRTFLKVEGPSGKVMYFRYYDPRVLRTYLPSANHAELSQVFGPVHEYAMENRQADALEFFPAPPVQVKSPGGLKIRAAQMAAFDAQAETQFIQHMTAQAQQQFPTACAPLKPEVLEHRVRGQIAKARRYDITTKKDVCDFIAVSFTLGDDFDSAPELPWAAEKLNDSTLPTGSSKMAYLLTQVLEHLERKTSLRSPR